MSNYIKVFPAANGDCFLIKIDCGENYTHILVDGGKGVICHKKLKEEFKYLDKHELSIDLLILTHIDDDHISGLIKLYQDQSIDTSIIKKVWFNSGTLMAEKLTGVIAANRGISLNLLNKKMSVSQGITLEKRLQETNSWYKELIHTQQMYCLGQAEDIIIDILSPDLHTLKDLNIKWEKEITKMNDRKAREKKMSSTTDYHKTFDELEAEDFQEDMSVFNKSSIAFILKYKDYKILMLGDSHPSVIVRSLRDLGYSEEKKLKLNTMKVSHHGSKKNTSTELLSMIDCTNFIVSTDGSKHGLPNKQSLVKIVRTIGEPVTFYFNYKSMKKILSPEECKENNITCIYLDDTNNYTVGD